MNSTGWKDLRMCLVQPFVRYFSLLSVSGHLVTLKFRTLISPWLSRPTAGWPSSQAEVSPCDGWSPRFAAQSCPTLGDPLDCRPPGFLCPWDSPGKNTGVGCRFLLQGIVLTHGWSPHLPCLLHRRRILYLLSHPSPTEAPLPSGTSTYSRCSTQWGHFYMKL